MKRPADYALVYEFDLKLPRKRQARSVATLFRPKKMTTGEWACRFVIRGPIEEDQTIYGEDSLQSLLLTLECLRFVLGRFQKRGALILYPGSKEEVDLQLYFRGISKEK